MSGLLNWQRLRETIKVWGDRTPKHCSRKCKLVQTFQRTVCQDVLKALQIVIANIYIMLIMSYNILSVLLLLSL